MALILNIETSVDVCSVNIARNKICELELTGNFKNDHISQLTILINSLLKQTGYSIAQLDAIAINGGPGSYTGIRIGTSVAKGICHAKLKPLISINALDSMTAGIRNKFPDDYLFCPLIDARRMEVYTALMRNNLEKLIDQTALILDHTFFDQYLKLYKIVFFGSGLEKGKIFLNNNHAIIYDAYNLSSSHMIELSLHKFNRQNFEDIALYEPDYAKPFYTVKK